MNALTDPASLREAARVRPAQPLHPDVAAWLSGTTSSAATFALKDAQRVSVFFGAFT